MSNARFEGEVWAAAVLADPKTVVLDTETTGLHGYACEIAVFDGREFLLDTLVNPRAAVEPGARKIHGITDEELSAAPVFGEVWPALEKIITERRVVVYNARFDSGVIYRELRRLGITGQTLNWEDAMAPYSDWWHEMKDAPYVRLNGGHRAGQDCAAVFERLKEMSE